MRFTAPLYASEVTLARGVVPVIDGAIDIADPTEAEIAGLRANGFHPAPAKPVLAPADPIEAPKPGKGKSADEAA